MHQISEYLIWYEIKLMLQTHKQHHMAKKGGKKMNPLKIQHYLRGVDYPVGRQELVDKAKENDAPEDVLSVLEHIVDREYITPAEVTKAAARVS